MLSRVAGASEPGARRILNGAIHETLTGVDADNHRLTYTIDDGPPPLNADAVTSYVGEIEVLPITTWGGTFIKWTSCYETVANGAVGEFCDPVYAALMGCLQSHFNA